MSVKGQEPLEVAIIRDPVPALLRSAYYGCDLLADAFKSHQDSTKSDEREQDLSIWICSLSNWKRERQSGCRAMPRPVLFDGNNSPVG
jgi:hypothetical protein